MSFSVDRIIARAERLAKAGDIEQAESLYGAVLEKFPQNTRAKDALAVLAKEARSSQAGAGALDVNVALAAREIDACSEMTSAPTFIITERRW